MKKSVRNIVSLVTSTCLVASLGAVSVNADSLELIDSSASNDTVVEQSSNSSSSTVATTQAVAATKSASTVDTASAEDSSSDEVAEEEVIVTNSVVSALATDGDVVAIDEDETEEIEEVEEETEETEEDDILGAAVSAATGSTNATVTTTTTADSVVIPVVTDGVTVEITPAITEAVEEAPVTKDVILTLDTSNSMNGQPKELVRQTATNLVTKILSNDENARIALVGFNGYAYHLSVYDEETDQYITYFDDVDSLITAINDMLDADNTGDGSTDLLDALYEVQFLLETSDGDEKSVVIMTDGAQGTNLIDEDGNVDYDISNRYVFGDDSANAYNDTIISFINDELKPLATIYTVGYLQNLSAEDAEISRAFLKELGSDGNDGTRYYEANDKNIDEITDLITQDIVHKAIKDAPSANSSSSSSSEDTSDSPKTSDAGVAPIMMVSALAGAMLLLTKKNK